MNSNVKKLLDALVHLKTQDRPALICIAGASGSGKSTLGKIIRKGGLPGVGMKQVAVIDDGVMSINLLGGLVRPKIKIPYSGAQDELAPFYRFIPKSVRFVFYINANPAVRVKNCDLLAVMQCKDVVRKRRLLTREGDRAGQYLDNGIGLGMHEYPQSTFQVFLDGGLTSDESDVQLG